LRLASACNVSREFTVDIKKRERKTFGKTEEAERKMVLHVTERTRLECAIA